MSPQRTLVGTIRLPRTLSQQTFVSGVFDGGGPDVRGVERHSTRIVFFDVFDPKPDNDAFPTELMYKNVIAVLTADEAKSLGIVIC